MPELTIPADDLASLLPPSLAARFLDVADGYTLSADAFAVALDAALRLHARDIARFFDAFAHAKGDLPPYC